MNTGRDNTVIPAASPDNFRVSVGSANPSSNTSRSNDARRWNSPAGITIRTAPGTVKSPPAVAGTNPARGAAAANRAVTTVSTARTPNLPVNGR